MRPDLNRVGGLEWTRRTGGDLTARERRRLLAEIVRAQAAALVGRFWLATGRVPDGAVGLSALELRPPDSSFAKEAEEAAREQSTPLVGHAYRSWIYGSGLAAVDRAEVDPELLYVACLLHDHGLTKTVAGEDFTLRGAARADQCGRSAGAPDTRVTAVADAITAHLTPGITVERDGALSVYVQAGALVDLAATRAGDLPRSYREDAVSRHPPDRLGPAIIEAVRAEAAANPRSRMGLLHRCGLTSVIRIATETDAAARTALLA